MHLSALLEFDVLPLDADDDVAVLLDITAPEQQRDTERAPATLQIVLDRSGSMAGARLQGAVQALRALVDRLDPTDNFGLVTFDHQARVEVAAGPLTDKAAVKARIGAIAPGGSTDLSSGLLRGTQEARRASNDQGATLLLISDGHANTGITDHAKLAECARSAYASAVTTTTLGYGLGYDEALLGAVADGGAGSALFAEEPDTAEQMVAQEVDYLLSKTAQAVSLRVAAGPHLRGVSVVGEMPSTRLGDGSVMVELGDFYSGEQRRLLLRLDVPGIAALGSATVTELTATYVDPASLTTYTATLPIAVNVVPGDGAAGRIPNPAVQTERVFQNAQTAKREASEALRSGDREQAARKLEQARDALSAQLPAAPPEQAEELTAQVAELDDLAARAQSDDASRTSKAAYSSQSGYSRKRSRMAGYSSGYYAGVPQAPGHAALDPAAYVRARVALEGLSVGDGFGQQFFWPENHTQDPSESPSRPWGWTDDTEMACSIVDILARHGHVDQDALAQSFADHYDPARMYGAGAQELLRRIGAGTPWRAATAEQFGGSGSFGNGAAMRVAPLGAYFAGDAAVAAAQAKLSAEITHSHPEGIAGAVAVAAAAAVAGGNPDATGEDLLEAALAHVAEDGVQVSAGLERARDLLGAPAAQAAGELGNGAQISAQDTVPFALWVAATHRDDYPEAMRTCVGAGGDMDTTAAIAGGVVAARLGTSGIPKDWRTAREPLPAWLLNPES